MRIRSCQLVYLLLLLCSVQGLESRAFAAMANGPATLAAQGESSAASSPAGLSHHAAARFVDAEPAGTCPQSAVPATADAARHAIAVATYTSFARG